MRIKRRPSPIEKKAGRGFRGYPVATIAFYGPDASRASKVAVGIVMDAGGEPEAMERWQSDNSDLREDVAVLKEVLEFIRTRGAKSVVLSDGIIGCPHEEGIDYREDQACPRCPYWANRDRRTGENLQ